jgi:hypothetical protein
VDVVPDIIKILQDQCHLFSNRGFYLEMPVIVSPVLRKPLVIINQTNDDPARRIGLQLSGEAFSKPVWMKTSGAGAVSLGVCALAALTILNRQKVKTTSDLKAFLPNISSSFKKYNQDFA